jgi:ribosomal protein L22
MSPQNPQDPQTGKPHEDVQAAEDAAAAKQESARTPAEQPEPTTSEGGTPSAEGTAAETTGVDKAAADALAAAGDEEPQAAPGDDDPAAVGADLVAEADVAAVAAADDEAVAVAGEDAPEAGDEEPPAEAVAEEAQASPRRSRLRRRKGTEETEPAAPTRRRTPAPAGVTVRAQAKYVRTSARKARLVCDHIRGKDVSEARAILAFTPRGAAKAWSKLLESAVANAEHNHELVGEELRILSVHADEGPTLKRFRPRAMGRATRIRKRTSHLSITLTPKEL